MMKIISLVFLVVILGATFFYAKQEKYSAQGNRIGEVFLGGQIFRVEIVDTSEKTKLGLGERSGICAECGMLFVFSESGQHSFWMNGMQFPLDILWIEKGKIVGIEKNIPFDSQEIFSPGVNADQVLELNAGIVDKRGIKNGDEVVLK